MSVGIFIKNNRVISVSHVIGDVGFGSARAINTADRVLIFDDDQAVRLARELARSAQGSYGAPTPASVDYNVVKSPNPDEITVLYDRSQRKYVPVTDANRNKVPKTKQDYDPMRMPSTPHDPDEHPPW